MRRGRRLDPVSRARCLVCNRDDRDAIDLRILEGEEPEALTEEHGIPPHHMFTHVTKHLHPSLSAAIARGASVPLALEEWRKEREEIWREVLDICGGEYRPISTRLVHVQSTISPR